MQQERWLRKCRESALVYLQRASGKVVPCGIRAMDISHTLRVPAQHVVHLESARLVVAPGRDRVPAPLRWFRRPPSATSGAFVAVCPSVLICSLHSVDWGGYGA